MGNYTEHSNDILFVSWNMSKRTESKHSPVFVWAMGSG